MLQSFSEIAADKWSYVDPALDLYGAYVISGPKPVHNYTGAVYNSE